MYITTREQALDALAEALRLPERRSQIIDMSVKIILCLHPEPRALLGDGLAGLIDGGLEAMAARRREQIESLQHKEILVVVDPEADRLFASAARAMDALTLAALAADLFPMLAADRECWEFARAIVLNEEGVRDCIVRGARARNTEGSTDEILSAQRTLAVWLDQARPAWFGRADRIRASLQDHPLGAIAFAVLAVDDTHAAPYLELLEHDPEGARAFAANFLDILETLRRLEAESGRPTDSRAYRRVA